MQRHVSDISKDCVVSVYRNLVGLADVDVDAHDNYRDSRYIDTVCACVRACVRACARVRVCMRARMRACVCVWMPPCLRLHGRMSTGTLMYAPQSDLKNDVAQPLPTTLGQRDRGCSIQLCQSPTVPAFWRHLLSSMLVRL